jgi:FixJ family two-component response regulator
MVALLRLACVVDDDASIRTSLTRLLSEHGYRVEAFESALEFLRCAPDRGASLLIDVSMPDMTGIELARRLQCDRRTDRVVLMSARDDSETRRWIEELGPVEFVRKPFRPEDLLAALARARALSTNA